MRSLVMLAVGVLLLVVPATASAADDEVVFGSPEHIAQECGANPSTQTVEQRYDLTPPTREQALAEFDPFPDGTEDAQRETYWQETWAGWLEERSSWEQTKANDQARFAKCVARIEKEQADYERDEAEQERMQERAERARRQAAKLRCQRVGDRRIWKSRPSVSCKAARKLARYGSVKGRRIAGWKQTSYASGHAGSRLVTRDDSRGEVHFYRVPTDPYMQAIWRKGQARIVVGSGGCDGMC